LGKLQRLYTLLKDSELFDNLPGTVVLLYFPILESLYSDKSLGRPDCDNRVQVIVRDLLCRERIRRNDLLK
jgi:hypothetical protein